MARLMQCPACPVKLQPLNHRQQNVLQQAWSYSYAQGVEVAQHGPAALAQLALVAHAMTVHPEHNLRAFMEAYLAS